MDVKVCNELCNIFIMWYVYDYVLQYLHFPTSEQQPLSTEATHKEILTETRYTSGVQLSIDYVESEDILHFRHE